ncbi:unnamed protein product [Spirodela intermedia]|uniref:Uncharacterized protein n=1 Tax=Spirodela intermedia TaxID=51605 RepID=A0A7I8IL28_SPIIN|nr:unnamed protein product [Spirodela intermedia]CAA6657871.1 unnamed protein product [Spirodela intermedia]
MSSSQISSGDLRRPDEKSPDECERTGGRHVAVTASCLRLLSPPVDVTEETAVTEELNGRTTDVRDSPSAGVFPRPESEGTAVDAVHSLFGNEATAGEEAPSDPTIDRMINAVTEAPPSDGHGHNAEPDPTVDLEINGGDHVAIKAPQLFAIADASAGTLVTSSTSDTVDVAPPEVALAQVMPAQPSEAALAQDVQAQAQVAQARPRPRPSPGDQAKPEQPAQAAPVQSLAQARGKSLRPKKKIGRRLLRPPSAYVL